MSEPYPLITWIVPDLEGWRGTTVHWAFIAIYSALLLPEDFHDDIVVRLLVAVHLGSLMPTLTLPTIQALVEEYNYAYPLFTVYTHVISGFVTWCFLW